MLIARRDKFAHYRGMSPQHAFNGLNLRPNYVRQMIDICRFNEYDDIEHSRNRMRSFDALHLSNLIGNYSRLSGSDLHQNVSSNLSLLSHLRPLLVLQILAKFLLRLGRDKSELRPEDGHERRSMFVRYGNPEWDA